MSLRLAQDRIFFSFFLFSNWKLLSFYFSVCICQKSLHLISKKMQYCVTVGISYSRVGSQEPLIYVIHDCISHTRRSISLGCPNNKKWVEKLGEAKLFEATSWCLDT